MTSVLTSPIERYHVIKKLGQHTYLVEDRHNNNCLKVRRIIVLDDTGPEKRDEILENYKAQYSLRTCENFVPLLDCFGYQNEIHLIFQYCEGGSLHALIARAKKYDEILNEIEILDWVVQLLKSLQHLHQQNIFHCRLSARDILLKDNAIQLREDAALITILRNPLKCKTVSDATEHESLGDTVFNMEKNMMSSICPFLLSDEGELSINPYADIWSLGCIVYELVYQKEIHTCSTIQSIKEFGRTYSGTSLPVCFSSNLYILIKRLLSKEEKSTLAVSTILEWPLVAEHIEEMGEYGEPHCVDIQTTNRIIRTIDSDENSDDERQECQYDANVSYYNDREQTATIPNNSLSEFSIETSFEENIEYEENSLYHSLTF